MKKLFPQNGPAVEAVEAVYSRWFLADQKTPWSRSDTLLAVSCATIQENEDRISAIAAQAILSQDVAIQDKIQQEYILPYLLVRYLEEPEMPEPIEVVTFEGNLELTVEDRQTLAIRRVNHAVGNVRRQYITDLPGQTEIYRTKAAEARRYLLADPKPEDVSAFMYLSKEAASTGRPLEQVSQIYSNLEHHYDVLASDLDAIRIAAIDNIEAAETEEAIAAAEEQFFTGFSDVVG